MTGKVLEGEILPPTVSGFPSPAAWDMVSKIIDDIFAKHHEGVIIDGTIEFGEGEKNDTKLLKNACDIPNP